MEPLNLTIYKKLYPHAEVIDSSQIFRNMKFHKIKSGMLTIEGEAIPYICRIVGNKLTDEAILRIVIFSRKYVIEKLALDLESIISDLDEDEWSQLMSDVYFHE
jgi:hypothetical protein